MSYTAPDTAVEAVDSCSSSSLRIASVVASVRGSASSIAVDVPITFQPHNTLVPIFGLYQLLYPRDRNLASIVASRPNPARGQQDSSGNAMDAFRNARTTSTFNFLEKLTSSCGISVGSALPYYFQRSSVSVIGHRCLCCCPELCPVTNGESPKTRPGGMSAFTSADFFWAFP